MWLTILYLGYKYAHNAFTQKVKMTSLDSKTVQVVQKCSYLDIRICWTAMCQENTVSWSLIRSQCFTQKRTMSVNNRIFAIARHQFTLTICPVYSKQHELTPSGRLVWKYKAFSLWLHGVEVFLLMSLNLKNSLIWTWEVAVFMKERTFLACLVSKVIVNLSAMVYITLSTVVKVWYISRLFKIKSIHHTICMAAPCCLC